MHRNLSVLAMIAALSAPLPLMAQQANGEGSVPAAAESGTGQAQSQPETIYLAQLRSYQNVVAELEAQNYTVTEIKRTFLGRIKITAQNNVHLRQVVVSSSTGEILQDAIVAVYAQENESTDDAATAANGTESSDGGLLDLSGGVSLEVDLGLGGSGSAGGGSAGGSASGSGGLGISLGN